MCVCVCGGGGGGGRVYSINNELKRNNLLPISFLLEWTSFQKGGKTILTVTYPLKMDSFPFKHTNIYGHYGK